MVRDLLQPSHLIVVVAVFALLFGGKKLPEAARGLGRSLRIFKSEMREMKEEDKKTSSDQDIRPTEALEGRVVDGVTDPSRARSEQHRDV